MSDAGTDDGTGSTSPRAASRGERAGVGRVEFGRTDSFLVRQPLAAGAAERVRDRIGERRPDDGSGATWLLPGDDVVTTSLFLAERDGARDALVWYVEVGGDGRWADPVATLARRTPLYGDSKLAGAARLRGDAERVIHASNPARPSRPDAADVVLVRLAVEPGLGTWLARVIAGLVDGLEGTWVGRTLRAAAGEVIEDERMWTETLFLDGADGEYAILWYMEAEDMDRVTEVYETTDNRVARWSEAAFEQLLGSPLAALGDPMDASEYELLAHETNPARR